MTGIRYRQSASESCRLVQDSAEACMNSSSPSCTRDIQRVTQDSVSGQDFVGSLQGIYGDIYLNLGGTTILSSLSTTAVVARGFFVANIFGGYIYETVLSEVHSFQADRHSRQDLAEQHHYQSADLVRLDVFGV